MSGILACTFISFQALTYSAGAPMGKSGSPKSSGQTCAVAGCHFGGPSVSTQTISVTSDIPTSGFAENTDYTFTVTLNDGGTTSTKVGFQASIEDASGHVGTITPGSSSERMMGSFVTHSSSGTPMSGGTRSYTFNWNSGTTSGGATVYVAANFTNGMNNTSGDVITSQTLAIAKESGISLNENLVKGFEMAPNPATGFVKISEVDTDTRNIELYGLDGRLIKTFGQESKTGSTEWELELSGLNTGIYLVTSNGKSLDRAQKLVVQ